MKAPASALADSRTPDENFPVASWLCPPRLRAPITAIYWFARTADDLADEGPAGAQERLASLAAYEQDLQACFAGGTVSSRWHPVFGPLRSAIDAFALPQAPLAALLSAFRQDVVKTRDRAGYADRAELLDYCNRSANPVGRLLLHLYGVADAESLRHSDCICTALQLTNFWQDLGVDVPRGRFYLPARDCLAHGIDPLQPDTWAAHPDTPALVRDLVAWTRSTMLRGAPLAKRVPGRAGWELRLVVQGGLRILDRIEAGGCHTFHARPALRARDAGALLWRAVQM
ncbi:squalene synthase HpnC [Ramlibacter sp.]|uniref:squalene synthase HpnC n=1 Tax=Ramlibacter sp. TaxID=1917967 RepID=UPI002CA788C0|nr:squalene synthase HpnC [Ramlibacter sp.]HWI80958.1 squalene synthase HpnC [Ramlibacter sp.]